MIRPINAQDARRQFDPTSLPEPTATGKPKGPRRIIGQRRALNALEFGLQVGGKGFNVFVSGPPGIGKMTSVQAYLERFASEKPVPDDWCFVHNFKDSYQPRAIRLSAGQGNRFKQDMEELRRFFETELPQVFESDEYSTQREKTLEEVRQQGQELSQKVEEQAEAKGFMMQNTVMGTALVPVKDGKPMSEEALQSVSADDRREMEKRKEELQEQIRASQKSYRKLDRRAQEKVKELDRQVVLNRIEGPIEDLKEKYGDRGKVHEYLDGVQSDILDNIDTLKSNPEEQGQNVPPQVKRQMQILREQFFQKYQVNVAVDNSGRDGAPVVVELNPTYTNLIGRIEKQMQMGALNTDFTLIKAGSILKANGGYLVLPVIDVLRNIGSWEALKRALQGAEIRIEEMQEQLGYMTVKSLRPQPIPLDVKIILIGRPTLHQLLHMHDDDFPELFKVKADFDTVMDADPENVQGMVDFVRGFTEREGLRHMRAGGVARLLEYSTRLSGHKGKFSTRFGDITDLVREANFWAGRSDASGIESEHVQKALDEKVYRSGLIKDKVGEMIEQGTLLIDTADRRAGQLNGLSFIDIGGFSFGRPNRITATIGVGREGVIDLERESRLGGPIHSKGVLILTGFLSRVFSTSYPLSISARIVFEQSYSGVDGDSASSAELYALLSALSGVPLRQSIAVTGSVNQAGEVQAVGGINEKIEGFFDVCSARGLSGDEGVLIPAANVQNLALRPDVAEAIERGDFAVWPAASIDEGIELLTGEPAGRNPDGTMEPESVFGRARAALDRIQESLKELRMASELSGPNGA
ncbi:Lon protease family protein [Salinispira pacifica]